MTAYSVFAKLYDKMMDNIPYEEWEQYLLMLMYKAGVSAAVAVTEIGCGTGTMTGLLYEEGFKVTGLDLSEDMLQEARRKYPDIVFNQGDMRDFELPEKQDAIVSVCDSINYVLTTDDLAKTFGSVKKNLKKDGVFIFDLKTRCFFENVLDGRTFRDRGPDFKCIWKNSFDQETCIHHYYLDIKTKDSSDWILSKEHHQQRAYTAQEIVEAAKKAGFVRGSVYDAFTFDKPRKTSERLYLVLYQ